MRTSKVNVPASKTIFSLCLCSLQILVRRRLFTKLRRVEAIKFEKSIELFKMPTFYLTVNVT